jgi:hypothetical protein
MNMVTALFQGMSHASFPFSLSFGMSVVHAFGFSMFVEIADIAEILYPTGFSQKSVELG